jgi:hypothetical protein
VYQLAGGARRLRATSTGKLQDQHGFRVLLFSTGEKSLGVFLGNTGDEAGRRKRLVDVPAEVIPGTSFETIASDRIGEAAERFYSATQRLHGAVGLEW